MIEKTSRFNKQKSAIEMARENIQDNHKTQTQQALQGELETLNVALENISRLIEYQARISANSYTGREDNPYRIAIVDSLFVTEKQLRLAIISLRTALERL